MVCAVAEVDDGQQDHDRDADRHDVLHAEQAQRKQQRERGFRSVRGGTERIKAKDGNAGDRADVLGALLAGGERPPKQQGNQVP